jgi:ABC-type thiamine transport system ATPase subunit
MTLVRALRLLAGLDQASKGSIVMDGRDVTQVPPVERGAATVFRLAVDNLLSLIGGEAPKVTEMLVQPRIAERESVRS